MKISAIYSYNTHKNPNTFKSTNRTYLSRSVKDAFCLGEVSNFTRIFRKDIDDWFKLGRYISESFKNKDRVNLYSLGCSDGSEAYTMAIVLKKFLGGKKAFPIIAVDKDVNIINHAKKGRINLTEEDIIRVRELLGSNQKYFTDMKEESQINDVFGNVINDWDSTFPMFYSYKVNRDLRNLVKFETGNLLKTVENLKDDSNTFVACRNVTPYLIQEDQDALVEALKTNLKSGSLVSLGDYDQKVSIDLELIRSGFSPTEIRFVYKKD